MAAWRVPALFLLLSTLVAAPATASDAKPSSDAAVVEAGAASPASQPTKAAVPKTVDEAVDTAKSVYSDFTSEKWRAGIAGIITLLVFAWRRFASGIVIGKLPTKALPFVTAGIAFLAAVPVALTVDPWSWKTFLWQGLITGAQAMAFWSLIAKFVLGKLLPSKE